MTETTAKQALLAYLAENHNHLLVEKIVNNKDDEVLFDWVLTLLKRYEILHKKITVIIEDFGK